MLKNKGAKKISIDDVDRYMQNMGDEHFSYEIFKTAFDNDRRLQNLVKDFNKDYIEIKTSELDDLKTNKAKKPDVVSKMAKKAVDI